MDPNAALIRFLDALRDANRSEALEALVDLSAWFSRGGFLPVDPRPAGQGAYLVWSHEHSKWWMENGTGYVKPMTHAGRFTRDAALRICVNALPGTSGVPNEIPVREADLVAMIERYRERYPRSPQPACE